MNGQPGAWKTYRKTVTVEGVTTYEIEAYQRRLTPWVGSARWREAVDGVLGEWTEWARVGRRFLRKEGLLP